MSFTSAHQNREQRYSELLLFALRARQRSKKAKATTVSTIHMPKPTRRFNKLPWDMMRYPQLVEAAACGGGL
jgi:hypothetical protein